MHFMDFTWCQMLYIYSLKIKLFYYIKILQKLDFRAYMPTIFHLPLKTILHIWHPYHLQVTSQVSCGKVLVRVPPDSLDKLSFLRFKTLCVIISSKEMILTLYVFSFHLLSWLLRLFNRSKIVTRQHDRNLLQSHNTKI